MVEWLAELALNAEDLGYIPGKPSTWELALLINFFFRSQHNQDWGKITLNIAALKALNKTWTPKWPKIKVREDWG